MSNLYRLLPSVDVCLRRFRNSLYPHALLCDCIGEFLQEKRTAVKNGTITEEDLEKEKIFRELERYAEKNFLCP